MMTDLVVFSCEPHFTAAATTATADATRDPAVRKLSPTIKMSLLHQYCRERCENCGYEHYNRVAYVVGLDDCRFGCCCQIPGNPTEFDTCCEENERQRTKTYSAVDAVYCSPGP